MTFFLLAEHQVPDTTALHAIFSEMDRTNNIAVEGKVVTFVFISLINRHRL